MSHRNNKLRGTSQPGQFNSSIRVDKVIRFISNNVASETAITTTNLGDVWINTPTAVTAFQMSQAFKLRKIEVWAGPTSSSLTPVTVSIDWAGAAGGTIGTDQRVSDTSVGATRVAHICTAPSKRSQLSQWQSTAGSALMFTISCPAGSVIDLHLSYTIRDDGTAQAAAVPVAAVAGANYLRGFDGLAAAGTNFTPQSYPVR